MMRKMSDFEREAMSHLTTLLAVGSRLTRSTAEAEDLERSL